MLVFDTPLQIMLVQFKVSFMFGIQHRNIEIIPGMLKKRANTLCFHYFTKLLFADLVFQFPDIVFTEDVISFAFKCLKSGCDVL